MSSLRLAPVLLAAVISTATTTAASAAPIRVLVFSKTAVFRHSSIPNGIAALTQLAQDRGWTLRATEDAAEFTPAGLASYDVVVFLLTTGNVLDPAQQAAFEDFVRSGRGYVGIHAAADTEYDWPWYGGLVGAWFQSHPAVQPATILVTDRVHPSTRVLPERWQRSDEWYDFRLNPRGTVHVLATIDERTYAGGGMGYDHPIAWCQTYDGGRAWYTALGHTEQSYTEPLFLAHLASGIEFAAGAVPGDCGATVERNYQVEPLLDRLTEPIAITVTPDGRVLLLQRAGSLLLLRPGETSGRVAGTLAVNSSFEDGLLGIALDPGFAVNGWLYLFYSPASAIEQRISRFTLVGDFLDLASEKVLLRIPTQRDECCHASGDLQFDGQANLYISAGDNTSPFQSDGFTPIDERPARSAFDAQKSSSNRNDLRGKILRIHPEPDGSYSIPPGNLFPADGSNGRPEIYVMGCRSPFRLAIDNPTGTLFWGDIGPDSPTDAASRGPRGYDEVNRTRTAGNFGWPYFIADNKPYVDYDFATALSRALFDPAAPFNDSPNNTGARDLPPARGAWIWYPYGPSGEFPEVGQGSRAVMAGPVYRYDPLAPDGRLPAYYDNTLFLHDWARNWLMAVRLDAASDLLKLEPFLPGLVLQYPIDEAMGPDGALYLLEWGAGQSNGRLSRISYRPSRDAPTAAIAADRTDGPVPLAVQFSAAASYDPNADPLSFEWDFEGDGVVDSTDPAPAFVFAAPGDYRVRLTVRDPGGLTGRATLEVIAGNTRPELRFELPPVDGGIFHWGDPIPFAVAVEDAEDGSLMGGGVSCGEVQFQPWIGHDQHAHPLQLTRRCAGTFQSDDSHGPLDDLYYNFEASYTDHGVAAASRLTGRTTVLLNPSRVQSEFFTAQSGLFFGPTHNPLGGGDDAAFIDDGDWLSLRRMNLLGINSVSCRASSGGLGGRVELHSGSIQGRLLASADIPVTGDWFNYTTVTAPLTDNNLFLLVDLGAPAEVARLVLDASGSPGDYPRRLLVFVSANGVDFRGPVARIAGSGAVVDIAFPAETARFVKLVVAEAAAAPWSIHELRLYRGDGSEIDRTAARLTASESGPGEGPGLAADGLASTRWTSGVAQYSGTRDLFLVFRRQPGDGALFNLNWIEFNGHGVSGGLFEPSRSGSELPLRLVKAPGGVAGVVLEKVPGATGYVLYDNALGTWYGSPRRTCVASVVDGGVTVAFDHDLGPGSRWLVAASADSASESSCGRDGQGMELNRRPGWPATAPCP